MSDNWKVIREEVHTYRNYVKRLPESAKKKASYCYLLKKEEIDRLLSLRENGELLDGVRIYLGGEIIEGHLVSSVHVVAVEKDGHQYNDYGVPGDLPQVAMAVEPGIKPLTFAATADDTDSGKSSTGVTAPCPAFCSKTNILNS